MPAGVTYFSLCFVFLFFFPFFFVVIKSENPYFASRPGLEVKPLGVCPSHFFDKVVLAVEIQFGEYFQSPTIHIIDDKCHTGWRRSLGCLIFIGHFPQKSPILSGSFAEMTCNPRHFMSLRHPV